jgi:hypothetical protein
MAVVSALVAPFVGACGGGANSAPLCDDLFRVGAKGPDGYEVACRPQHGDASTVEIYRFRCADGAVLANSGFGWWIEGGPVRALPLPLADSPTSAVPGTNCVITGALGPNQSGSSTP